jgi:MSHA pilin protein MshD
MNSKRQAGITLIELILFIVVVGVGLVGILSVMNLNVQHSADPAVRKQAAALADSILEEILLKEYADPGGPAESGRADFDNIDDYNDLSNAAFTDLPMALANYVIAIAVADGTAALGVTARRVTVTVSRGGESISIVGYRASY